MSQLSLLGLEIDPQAVEGGLNGALSSMAWQAEVSQGEEFICLSGVYASDEV